MNLRIEHESKVLWGISVNQAINGDNACSEQNINASINNIINVLRKEFPDDFQSVSDSEVCNLISIAVNNLLIPLEKLTNGLPTAGIQEQADRNIPLFKSYLEILKQHIN